jgi:hypothetical protein
MLMDTVDSRVVCYILMYGSKGLLIISSNSLPLHVRSLFSENPLVVGMTSQGQLVVGMT